MTVIHLEFVFADLTSFYLITDFEQGSLMKFKLLFALFATLMFASKNMNKWKEKKTYDRALLNTFCSSQRLSTSLRRHPFFRFYISSIITRKIMRFNFHWLWSVYAGSVANSSVVCCLWYSFTLPRSDPDRNPIVIRDSFDVKNRGTSVKPSDNGGLRGNR